MKNLLIYIYILLNNFIVKIFCLFSSIMLYNIINIINHIINHLFLSIHDKINRDMIDDLTIFQ